MTQRLNDNEVREPDIIVVSPDVEIHPSGGGGWWAVVLVATGRAYSTHADLELARDVADGLAAAHEEDDDAE